MSDSKIKVLYITSMGDPPYLGGIENVIDTLFHSELANIYNLFLFDTYRKPNPNRKLISKALYSSFLFSNCLFVLIKKRPHIVHIHFCSGVDFWKHSICLLASKLTGRKTVFHLHGGSFDLFYNNASPSKARLIRYAFNLSDIVVALSNYWLDFLSPFTKKDLLRILPNPINCDQLLSFSNQTSSSNYSIVLLGSLGRRKGHYDVLKALPKVLEKHPDTHIYFGGIDEDTGATRELKQIAKTMGIEQSVHFLGPVSGEKKLKLIGESTVVILPSYGENMPISVMEGMAAGKPIISTRVGAIPEVLENGKCGIVIDAGDWESLAKNIIEIFDNPEYAEKLGAAALKKIRENWDIKMIAKKLDAIYGEVLH